MTGAPDAHVAPGFPVVGVIGGGQLARMMQQPAIALGIGLRVLATSIEDSAAQAVRDVRLGSHDDLEALRAFAAGCDMGVCGGHAASLVPFGDDLEDGLDGLPRRGEPQREAAGERVGGRGHRFDAVPARHP